MRIVESDETEGRMFWLPVGGRAVLVNSGTDYPASANWYIEGCPRDLDTRVDTNWFNVASELNAVNEQPWTPGGVWLRVRARAATAAVGPRVDFSLAETGVGLGDVEPRRPNPPMDVRASAVADTTATVGWEAGPRGRERGRAHRIPVPHEDRVGGLRRLDGCHRRRYGARAGPYGPHGEQVDHGAGAGGHEPLRHRCWRGPVQHDGLEAARHATLPGVTSGWQRGFHMTWFKKHGPALAALAGAIGTAAAALQIPGTVDAVHVATAIGGVLTVAAMILHAYVQGATGSGS